MSRPLTKAGAFLAMLLFGTTLCVAEDRDANTTHSGAIFLENKCQSVLVGGVGWLDCNSSGSQLLVCNGGGVAMQVLDTATMQVIRKMDPFDCEAATFAADDKLFVCGVPTLLGQADLEGVRIVQADTLAIVEKLAGYSIFRIDKGHNLLGYTSENTAFLYDLKKRTVVRSVQLKNTKCVSFHNFSASGIAGLSPLDPRIPLLWFPPYDKDPLSLDVGKGVNELQVSPDGRTAALGTWSNDVWIWDVEKNALIRKIGTHTGGKGWEVRALLFSPDGHYLVSLSNIGEAIVWDTHEYKEIGRIQAHHGVAVALAFFPDSRRFATGGHQDDLVKVWRIQDEKEKRQAVEPGK